MIKLSGTGKDGRKLILLALEEMNIVRLREGHPVHIHADDLGFPGEIVIILGKNVDDLKKQLEPMIGPETRVRDHRNQKRN